MTLRWPDLAEWRGPTPNTGPAMAEQRGLVVHIAEGYYEGTISYQKNPSASVSSHFVLAGPVDAPYGVPDGKLAQVVDLDVAAWTQRAGNGHWVSVECAGFTPKALSPAQCESIARLYARGMRELGWPAALAGNPDGKGLGYHSMGTPSNGWTGPTWGHEDCPGPNIIAQLPSILERAIQINGGDIMLVQVQGDDRVWSVGDTRRRHIPNRPALDALKSLGATVRVVTLPKGADLEQFLTDAFGPVDTELGGGAEAVLVPHTHDTAGTTGPAKP